MPVTTSPQQTSLAASSGPDSTPSPLFSLLAEAVEQVDQLGGEFNTAGQKLQSLRNQLAEERFHLAVLDQFKRGKSTLLNVLPGQTLLPISVMPLAAIPTFLFPAAKLQARIIYHNGKPAETFTPPDPVKLTALRARFVTEEGNSHNRHNVAHVEEYHPASLLHRGVVLIDTPGIGSTFRHNTQATLNFLPPCAAALFLVSNKIKVLQSTVAHKAADWLAETLMRLRLTITNRGAIIL